MPDPSTLVAGETLVDFIPDRPGTLDDIEVFAPRPGGAPANVAVAMTRLGAPPWFLSRIATDEFGDHLTTRLADEGVPDRFVQRDDDHATTLAFVTHDESADRSFSFYRDGPADERITASPIPDDVLDAVDRVAIGGVSLTTEPARTAMFDLVDRAQDHECTIVFDPNSRPELWPNTDQPMAVIERMLEQVDVVKTSTDDFARFDYSSAPEQLADRLLALGPHTVLLTLGRAGAAMHATAESPWGMGSWAHDGYLVDVVDTTGAGDAFLGGFLAALDDSNSASETDPKDLLGYANAVAALATTGDGAWTALPDRDAVADLQRNEH